MTIKNGSAGGPRKKGARKLVKPLIKSPSGRNHKKWGRLLINYNIRIGRRNWSIWWARILRPGGMPQGSDCTPMTHRTLRVMCVQLWKWGETPIWRQRCTMMPWSCHCGAVNSWLRGSNSDLRGYVPLRKKNSTNTLRTTRWLMLSTKLDCVRLVKDAKCHCVGEVGHWVRCTGVTFLKFKAKTRRRSIFGVSPITRVLNTSEHDFF